MTDKELNKDINIALKLLYKNSLNYFEKKEYGKIYPWSNENIKSYYNHVNLNNKKVLSVTSSGDHILYATLGGAKQIDSFDKNRLCKYYSALKIALILAYDEKDFYKFFVNRYHSFLSCNIPIDELKEFLDNKYYIFWKELMSYKCFKNNRELFRFDGIPLPIKLDYKLLKVLLKNVKINYLDMKAEDIILNKKYDVIFLSNLLEWMDKSNRKDILISFINMLNKDGVLYDYYMKRDISDLNDDLNLQLRLINKYVVLYKK